MPKSPSLPSKTAWWNSNQVIEISAKPGEIAAPGAWLPAPGCFIVYSWAILDKLENLC
jgi:hypothetical protein